MSSGHFIRRRGPFGELFNWRITWLINAQHLLATVLLAIVAGCTANTATLDRANAAATTLRLASKDSTSLNSAFDLRWTGVPRLVFSFLTTIGPSGGRMPEVATEVPTRKNGGISKDGLTVIFHLRHNVQWQDGIPLTAADCAFTFTALSDPASGIPAASELANIASVTARDRYTLLMHLKHRGAVAAQAFLSEDLFPILPAHLLAKVKPSDLRRAEFSQHPIGSGPYRVVEWIRGDHLTLAANPLYFRGRPKIDEIRLIFIDDANTIVNELRTDELDGALILDPVVYDRTRSLPGMHSVLTPQPGMGVLVMNGRSGPTADIRVRKAIAAALDIAHIAQITWPGQPKIANPRQFFLGLPYSNSALTPFNVAKAMTLLDAAGWHVRPDALRYRGREQLALELDVLDGQPSFTKDAVTIEAALRQVGIVVTIRQSQGARLLSPTGPLFSGRFGLSILDPTRDSHDTGDFYSCWAIPPNGFNFSRLCDPRVDAAEFAQASAADEAEQRSANAKLETLLEQDVPEIPLWQQQYISVYTNRLHGVHPTRITPYFHAWEWSLEPATPK